MIIIDGCQDCEINKLHGYNKTDHFHCKKCKKNRRFGSGPEFDCYTQSELDYCRKCLNDNSIF